MRDGMLRYDSGGKVSASVCMPKCRIITITKWPAGCSKSPDLKKLTIQERTQSSMNPECERERLCAEPERQAFHVAGNSVASCSNPRTRSGNDFKWAVIESPCARVTLTPVQWYALAFDCVCIPSNPLRTQMGASTSKTNMSKPRLRQVNFQIKAQS
jgi:ribosomal protein L37E